MFSWLMKTKTKSISSTARGCERKTRQLHVAPFTLNDVGAEFVPFQVPLKPGPGFTLAPAATPLLYEALVTVTLPPVWETLPFQSCVIVCPLTNANVRVQLLQAVVPVLVIAMFALKPLDH